MAAQIAVLNAKLFEQATEPPKEAQTKITGDTKITEDVLERMTSGLEPQRVQAVRAVLEKYLG
jgi:hypothetical protein